MINFLNYTHRLKAFNLEEEPTDNNAFYLLETSPRKYIVLSPRNLEFHELNNILIYKDLIAIKLDDA